MTLFSNEASPLISIIIPVYKAEAFLERCLKSALSQTGCSFELLLIDDGSPDNCHVICDDYASKYPNVHVIHKQNGGVSSARNAGLDYAKGEYIVFIDSDDYVDSDYLKQMLHMLHEMEVPEKTLIMTDYQPFSPSGDEKRCFPQPFFIDMKKPPISQQIFRDLVFGFRVFPPYCKLYRRDIIETQHLRFNESIRTAEDFDFNMRYLAFINYLCYNPISTYHYRIDYKHYKPSNHGVLGDSEIKSAHILANGIIEFAKNMGVYNELKPEICRWVARKHYFNRMPMLFAQNETVGKMERKRLFRRLTSDTVYRSSYKEGIKLMRKSTTRTIGVYFDYFEMWYMFYKKLHKRQTKKKR